MALQFSDTTNKSGILQILERTLYGEDGYGTITDNTTKLKTATNEINLALSRVLSIIFKTDGTWQFDDTNHTKYPIIKTNLVSGQRDYNFTLDEQGNPILDIFRVAVLPSSTATIYEELDPMDEFTDRYNNIVTERSNTGVPSQYGKLANGIFLDVPTNYDATKGLKIFINREASYFTTADTTKKPGFAGLFHEYLPYRAAYNLSRDSNLRATLEVDMVRLEKEITEYYARRERDVRKRITPRITPFI